MSLITSRSAVSACFSLLALGGATHGAVLLDIDFEGYAVGNVNGQSGGTHAVSASWNAPGTGKNIVTSPAIGTSAVSLSRDSGANTATTITLASPELDPSLPAIYYSFDFYRGDDNDAGVITLQNNASFNNTGFGISIESGASPLLRLITGGGFQAQDTTYNIENEKWHRVEFELNGNTLTYDVYVQKEGAAGRLQIGNDIAWTYPNGVVNGFLYYAQGPVDASNVILDNLYLETGVTFPVDRPLVVPEPAVLSLLAFGPLLGRRRHHV